MVVCLEKLMQLPRNSGWAQTKQERALTTEGAAASGQKNSGWARENPKNANRRRKESLKAETERKVF